MLVDLGRNDLSRVCAPGTVRVERFLEAERYSHVTHLVSEVAGELAPGRTGFDLLRACFPAGTVSGAPKVRAMQIISELEGYRRGPVRRRGRLRAPGRVAGHVHRDPHGRPAPTASRGSRPARASSPTPIRPPSTRSACNKLAALEAALDRRGAEWRPHVILLVDNYDSFTYNLAHLFEELGAEVTVLRNDAIDADGAERLAPSHLVISPGPGRPEDAGASVEIVRRLGPRVPTLGVCLGHQAIVEAFGGEVGPGEAGSCTGRRAPVTHDGRGIFDGPAGPARGRALPLARRDAASRTSSRSARRPRTARSWPCATASCRSTASSSTRSRC